MPPDPVIVTATAIDIYIYDRWLYINYDVPYVDSLDDDNDKAHYGNICIYRNGR